MPSGQVLKFIEAIPEKKKRARYYVAIDDNRSPLYGGFASKESANKWISSFGHDIDWRVGFYFRLKSLRKSVSIVDKEGKLVV